MDFIAAPTENNKVFSLANNKNRLEVALQADSHS